MTVALPLPVLEEERAEYAALGLWRPGETLSSLLARHAGARPGSPAVSDARGTRLTYAELDTAATSFAAELAVRGVGAGDVVGVQLPNFAEASVVHCAVDRLGAVAAPLVTMFRDHELTYMAEKTGMTALVVPGEYRRFDHDAMARRVATEVAGLTTLVSLSEAPGDGIGSFARMSAAPAGGFEPAPADSDAAAAILFTSGTEAAPKGVVHTNDTLLANARALEQILGMDADSSIFMASPVGHGTGYGFGIRLAVLLGSALVLQDVWDPARAAATLSRERCQYTHASTTFAQDLLDHPGTAAHEYALRWFVSGGANVPAGFVARMREVMGCTLLRLYGQTEAFMTTINRPEDPIERLENFDGRAAPGVSVEIQDEHGTALPAGQPGNVVCRGPHRCRGFIGDAARTAKTFGEGRWMSMGDLCTVDEDGYLRVVGRTKEVISRGGYKFSPREVEDLLLEHPRVSRAAVLGTPDDRLGERACAVVIPFDGDGQLVLADITSFLRERGLAPYKLPERLVLVDEFPMTASGKVQKFELAKRLPAAG